MKTPWQLHLIALLVVAFTLSAEGFYLFFGSRAIIQDVLLGRILGTLDASLTLVLGFYFTASMRQQANRTNDPAPMEPMPKKGE